MPSSIWFPVLPEIVKLLLLLEGETWGRVASIMLGFHRLRAPIGEFSYVLLLNVAATFASSRLMTGGAASTSTRVDASPTSSRKSTRLTWLLWSCSPSATYVLK